MGARGSCIVITTQKKQLAANFSTSSASLVDIDNGSGDKLELTLPNRPGGKALVCVMLPFRRSVNSSHFGIAKDGVNLTAGSVGLHAKHMDSSDLPVVTMMEVVDLDGGVVTARCSTSTNSVEIWEDAYIVALELS